MLIEKIDKYKQLLKFSNLLSYKKQPLQFLSAKNQRSLILVLDIKIAAILAFFHQEDISRNHETRIQYDF